MKTRLIVLVAVGFLAIPLVARHAISGGAKQKKTELQGTWKVIKGNDEVKLIKFAGNKFAVTFGDRVFEGVFELRPFDSPKGIDMLIKKTPKAEYEGKTALGIYKIEGDKLTWCSSSPGRKRRPPSFTEVLGDAKLVLATFKKVKK